VGNQTHKLYSLFKRQRTKVEHIETILKTLEPKKRAKNSKYKLKINLKFVLQNTLNNESHLRR